ncbi:hypothetical protein BLNAU_21632 [Blattamonas nauphoetae]|uniref:Uncharacterized protein n=1 Tax=Blattamonas nauphoetae TaxID=2049346 RepID=A0ABQ9WWE5_9EUKA|nr:hypothetical protein BLNAU_21632 [Blattamonas nauphoetae]
MGCAPHSRTSMAILGLFEQTACIGSRRHILKFVHVGVFVVRHFQHNQTSLELHCCHFLMLSRSSMEHGWIGLPLFCPADSISCFSELELHFTELDGIVLEQNRARAHLCEHAIFGAMMRLSSLRHERDSSPHFARSSPSQYSTIHNSKVIASPALVVGRAVRFLKNLEKVSRKMEEADQLVADLVPSSPGQRSGFVESILTLLSSPHSTIIAATLSFINHTTTESSQTIRCRLVESDLITKVFSTIQPHLLPISGNETIINHHTLIIIYCINLASPSSLQELGVTAASLHLEIAGIECEMAVNDSISNDTSKLPLSNDSNSFLRTLLGCWEYCDCWCRRTDSGMASNRPEMVCSFGLVVVNAAVFDCHIVNRPLSTQFLASLNDAL